MNCDIHPKVYIGDDGEFNCAACAQERFFPGTTVNPKTIKTVSLPPELEFDLNEDFEKLNSILFKWKDCDFDTAEVATELNRILAEKLARCKKVYGGWDSQDKQSIPREWDDGIEHQDDTHTAYLIGITTLPKETHE